MDLRESTTRAGVRHPWERARFDFLVRRLGELDALSARRVLDVGAGDAWFATRLLPHLRFDATITCVDASYDDDVVRRLALPARVSAAQHLPDASFDLVLALDVAEHVEDDLGFVRGLRARIAPGGCLLFTVPAWPALFSDHDRALGHHRRYTPDAARDLLTRAGFTVVRSGGFFHALVLARLGGLLAERLRPQPVSTAPDTAFGLGEGVASLVTRVLVAEHRITEAAAARGVELPGLSFFAVARPQDAAGPRG